MPFAGYQNFDACVDDQRAKGKGEDAARRICGALQARVEKQKSGETENADVEVTDEQVLSAVDHLDDEDIEILTISLSFKCNIIPQIPI